MGCACVKSDVVVRNQMMRGSELSSASKSDLVRERMRDQSMDNNNPENIYSGNYRNNARSVSVSNNNVSSNTNNNVRDGQARRSSSHGRSNNSQNVQNLMARFNISGSNIPNSIMSGMPFLQSLIDENFNFPEIDGIFVGTGLSRMKGYVSSIPFEELEKKRADFWGKLLR